MANEESPDELTLWPEQLRRLRDREAELRQQIDWLRQQLLARQTTSDGPSDDERFRVLVDHLPLLTAVHREGRCVFVNQVLTTKLGYRAEELIGAPIISLVHPDDRAVVLERVRRVSSEQVVLPYLEERLLHRDGSEMIAEIRAVPIRFDGLPSTLVFALDITERRRAEDHLRRSARMEAVGRLAGGVAHDFNNLLSIILNSAHFMLQQLSPDDAVAQDAQQIQAAARRAAELTRQLLTFSRGAEPTSEVVNVNSVILDLRRLLTGTLGESIELRLQLAALPCRVQLARSNLEQILINLAVNARDAMPAGGTLTLSTQLVEVHEPTTSSSPEPGHYVRLIVNDTGTGMPAEVSAHAFEPFFTTKPTGQGTGLGLSITYGIVHKAGGKIVLDSAPGVGTSFTLWLPACDTPSLPTFDPRSVVLPRGEGQSVLVVEDEEGLAAGLARLLRQQGYLVAVATSPEHALALVTSGGSPPRLLLTDVILPRMPGPVLAHQAQQRVPDLRVLFMSGYTGDALAMHNIPWDDGWVLRKPFEPQQLINAVQAALSGPVRRVVP